MWIQTSLGAEPELRDAEDFKRFSVVAKAGEAIDLGSAGVLDESGHAHIRLSWLRGQGSGTDEWTLGLEAMLAYAETNGWVDAAADTVRAHVDQS
jgi:hypothetical protein